MAPIFFGMAATGAQAATTGLMGGGGAVTWAQTAMTTVLGFMSAGQIQQGRYAVAQGRSQQKMANYNAIIQQREARAIEQKAAFDSLRQAKAARQRQGLLRTAIADSGAMMGEGAPADLESEQRAEDELENMLIGYEGRTQVARATAQGGYDVMSGEYAKKRGKAGRTASQIGVGATLLRGFA